RVRPAEGAVRVEVLDDGPGIPPEHLARIFDPFYTTKPPGEGSGLGLSVSYGIVTEHGGKLWAENRAEGGAAFHLELPIAGPEMAGLEFVAPRGARAAPLARRTSFMTGNPRSREALAIEADGAPVLGKPFTLKELAAVLRTAAQR